MSIQVLLGIADRELASRLSAQFQELPDLHVAAVETTSDDVISASSAFQGVDVVLVHQGLGPLPALDLIRELGIRFPQLAVILIADEATAETFAAAMTAGARGAISNEPTLSELQSRVGQAAEWSRTMRRHFDPTDSVSSSARLGTLLAVCGAKGGTGTTTVSIHLAMAVAAARRTVCLVDMDLQKGDLPSYMDVQHRHSLADLARADELDGSVVAEALYVHPSGPHLLLAPNEGEESEEITARAIRQILNLVRARYDVVIVDCGAYMGDANAMAVEQADRVLITTTPDLPALRGAKRLVKLWSRLQVRKDDELSVVLVRSDRRNEIQPDLARKMVSAPLLGTTVPAMFRALEEAANTAAPQEVKNPDFRKAIGQIARELGLLGSPAAREKVQDAVTG
jgi:pilus assembly protein CpaE